MKFQGHSFPFQLCGFCLSAHLIQSNSGWIQPKDQRPEKEMPRKSFMFCRRWMRWSFWLICLGYLGYRAEGSFSALMRVSLKRKMLVLQTHHREIVLHSFDTCIRNSLLYQWNMHLNVWSSLCQHLFKARKSKIGHSELLMAEPQIILNRLQTGSV